RNLLVSLVILCSGCASYVTPGGPARLDHIDRADIAEIASRRPTLSLPARLAIVRVQSPDYRSYSTAPYASDGVEPSTRGQFTVLTTLELLTDAQMEAVSSWPSV